ncbi:hypothetical protein AB0G04_36115 [Actinoplanes sp. NPDC023801]|uniref:hypothetical protein n=1 Tax=Actinoplanes sp. NPDC023801 TaxID=3154595 RepID=UPI0033D5720D
MSGHDPLALADWQRIRRYAVPAWMIAECTAARERGDWRAACAAALVDVRISEPGPVADLLAGFAPDLLRWHLPRALGGSTELASDKTYVLAPDGPVGADTPVLVARVPARLPGADPLILEAMPAGEIDGDLIFPVPRYRWDARRAGELGALARPPAGPVVDASADDRAAGLEAWAAAGWLFGDDDTDGWQPRGTSLLGILDPLLTIVELRRVTAQFGRRSWAIWADRYQEELRFWADGEQPRMTPGWNVSNPPNPLRVVPCLHPGLLRPPVDLDLVRHGLISPDALHPLVREALFPRSPASAPQPPVPAAPSPAPAPPLSASPDSAFPASPRLAVRASQRAASPRPAYPVADPGYAGIVPSWFGDEELIRVRCGAGWHQISVRNGRLGLPAHTDAERQRERTLRALGGASGGCFNTERAWNGAGDGPPPKRLRAYRRDLWLRMRHGGTRTVLALLDAGMDPYIRDGRGRTLLHRLHGFDHGRLLPRLLSEGLDVNCRDRVDSIPLFEAVLYRWPADLIIALTDAGADPRLEVQGRSPLDVLDEIESAGDSPDDEEWQIVTDHLRERA